jgi:hypothetical protein
MVNPVGNRRVIICVKSLSQPRLLYVVFFFPLVVAVLIRLVERI